MLNFIKADMFRVLKKKSFVVLTAIVFAAYAITLFISLKKDPELIELVSGLLSTAAILLIGIPAFIGVFTDDFNSKAMQTIIGFGVSRRRLVLSRYCEYLVILAQAFALISLMALIMVAVSGHVADSGALFAQLWKNYLVVAMCVSIAIIIVYGAQNTTFGLVVFIALAADLLSLVLTALSFVPFFSKHNIDPSLILPSNIIREAIDNGKPAFFIAAICYIVVPLVLSIKLFEKKELEF